MAISQPGSARAAEAGRGLVLPSDPLDDTRTLARTYARFLSGCCRQFLALDRHLPAALHPAHARVAALVRAALQTNQRALLSCFASPTVTTPMQCLALRDELDAFRARIDAAGAGLIPHLLLEMGLRQLLPVGESLLWEHGAPRLDSITIGGTIVPPAGSTALRFSASHIAAVRGGDELGRLPMAPAALRAGCGDTPRAFRFAPTFRRVGKVSHFATVDHNPIAAFEAHPDKAGNHIDLGERSADEWVATLDQCFALLERYMPGELAEMRTMLHEIIPVGYDTEKHLSASYREAVGTIYLTLHPNLMTMTEALIHEFQHNKFNVSAYSVAYLENAFHPLYKSPIRPDPRPLWGIMLAVHAFLPVAELYRRMRDAGHPGADGPDFTRRMSELDLKNHEGMEMLRAHAQLTPAGQGMFADLETLERRHLADRAARGLDNTPTDIHLA